MRRYTIKPVNIVNQQSSNNKNNRNTKKIMNNTRRKTTTTKTITYLAFCVFKKKSDICS